VRVQFILRSRRAAEGILLRVVVVRSGPGRSI
jgi:hypothetical protein